MMRLAAGGFLAFSLLLLVVPARPAHADPFSSNRPVPSAFCKPPSTPDPGLAGLAVHVAVPPICQTDVPPASYDPGQEDCLAASTAMILLALQGQGTVPASATVTYEAVRTQFRTLAPNVTLSISSAVPMSLVPGLTQDAVTADSVQTSLQQWTTLLRDQLLSGYPVIAMIGNWSTLTAVNPPHLGEVPHAIVLTGLGASQVAFVDPWDGHEYLTEQATFARAWQTGNWYAIVFSSQTPAAGAPMAPALVAPHAGDTIAASGITLQWADMGKGVRYEVELWEEDNSGNWWYPEPAWQDPTSWRVGSLGVGPIYQWRVRGKSLDGTVGPWSSMATFGVDTTLPPPPTVIPIAPIPSGTWLSPADGSTITSASFHFAAHAYPTNPGDPPIDHVNFTVWWPALGPESSSWKLACSVPTSMAKGDVYGCDGSLQGIPAGQVKVSFDVYDQAGNPNLSPNGVRSLVYQPSTADIAYVSPSGDLVISKLDGTNARKLVSGPIARPAWSPDGTRIAYLRLAHPANRPSLFGDQIFGDQIEMVNVDGTGHVVLVPPRLSPVPHSLIQQYQAFVRVRWAPDGAAIYYMYAFGNVGGKGVIRYNLAPSAEHDLGTRAFGHDFDIARDGTLALVDYENAGAHAGDNLYLLLANGTTRYIVSNPPSGPGIEGPTWSPDGMTIATVGPGGYVIDRNGRSRTIIDSVRGVVTAVTWSPDGARVAFAQGSSLQGSSIWTVSTSGGPPMKLFAGSDPSWGPATAQ